MRTIFIINKKIREDSLYDVHIKINDGISLMFFLEKTKYIILYIKNNLHYFP